MHALLYKFDVFCDTRSLQVSDDWSEQNSIAIELITCAFLNSSLCLVWREGIVVGVKWTIVNKLKVEDNNLREESRKNERGENVQK